jgi:hypothetical protein
MPRLVTMLGLFLAAAIGWPWVDARAGTDLEGSSWTVVVTEQCQLGQIGKVLLQSGGAAQATAIVESSAGSNNTAADTQSTDLQGNWSYAGDTLHLSFNDGSLTLDGPVKDGKFLAKAAMKTDLGDPLQQDCLFKRN